MAEIDYAQAGEPAPTGAPVSTFVNIAGAVMSLVLLAGVAVWGYKLLSRDVTGVPVVQALSGPMRVAPEDPGGEPADHQGLAVNDVAARGSASAPADTLVLAPRPVRLMAEDQPVSQMAGQGAEPVTQAAQTTVVERAADAEVAALVERLTEGVEPMQAAPDAGAETAPKQVVARLETPADVAEAGPELMQTEPDAADTAAAPAADDTPETVVVTGPGLKRSLRPHARPARDATVAAAVQTAAADTGIDVNPDDLPVGTRLAQLGAYDSAEIARAQWDKAYAQFEDYMDGKKRVIQMASSGGRTFFRLRAMGFADLSDARRFCAVLVAENADCIPVTTR